MVRHVLVCGTVKVCFGMKSCCILIEALPGMVCCMAGVSIVSPQWVLRSLKGGQAQRCLQVSLDTVPHLPASSCEQAGSKAFAPEQLACGMPSAALQTHGEQCNADTGPSASAASQSAEQFSLLCMSAAADTMPPQSSACFRLLQC